MKRHLWLLVACTLSAAVLLAAAAQSPPAKAPAAKPAPGLEAAQTLSTLTGVAISPLLGVSAVGAWKWYQTPTERRAQLPWFAQPLFWAAGLLLVGAVALKDSLGTAVPSVLKKPLDAAEALENKISGLVAAGAFVPMLITLGYSEPANSSASLGGLGFATVDAGGALNLLLVPFAMAAFLIVWVVGHAINMLILISPFSTVDAGLKAFRTFLMGTVAVTSFINPWGGAVWSIIIIIICYFLAGWAMRLTVFGSLFLWDFFTLRRLRFKVDPAENKMFLATAVERAPIRTYGRLTRGAAGELVFTYRPWLVLPRRTLTLPAGKYAVGRGLLYPELLRLESGESTAVLLLPPRYRTHEAELNQVYGLAGVQDVGIVKGLKALWNFLKELCGVRPRAAIASAN